MISTTGAVFSRLIGSVSVIIVIAGLVGGSDVLSNISTNKTKWGHSLLIGLAGGLFSIYGNLSGIDVNGALVTIRDIGPMLAAFLGGPVAGVVAGLMAGIHRYTLGGITAEACIVATCLIGVFCGILSRHFKGEIFTPAWAFIIGALMEGMHLVIVMLMVKPVSVALDICKSIAIPFILINATGLMLFVFLITYIWKQKDLAADRARLKAELNAASVIQHSLLPPINEKRPGRSEVVLNAFMEPAKEVGGDFYDFFFVDKDNLVLVIADVSGKGIPGAIFMANAKQTLQNCIRDIPDIAEAVSTANNALCENNEAEMFVTAWIGVIELKSGVVRFVNAGHNPPVLIRSGRADFVTAKGGVVLAAMEDMAYRENNLRLNVGDKLFLYTDGVTEAENSSHELYGDDRLLSCLAQAGDSSVDDIINMVRTDTARHVGEHDQFDDMTMMCIEYRGA